MKSIIKRQMTIRLHWRMDEESEIFGIDSTMVMHTVMRNYWLRKPGEISWHILGIFIYQ